MLTSFGLRGTLKSDFCRWSRSDIVHLKGALFSALAAISAGRKCAIAGSGDWLHATGCGGHGLAAGSWYVGVAVNGVRTVSALNVLSLCTNPSGRPS
jgi:hypothetical protein